MCSKSNCHSKHKVSKKQTSSIESKTTKKQSEKTIEFIKKAIKIHGDKYDYSLVEYVGTDNKIKIVCKEHGIFKQKPTKHLQNQGCPICSESKLEKETRIFLNENNARINFSLLLSWQEQEDVL